MAARSRDGVAHFGTVVHFRYDELHAIVKVTAAVVTMNILGKLWIFQDRMLRAPRENHNLRRTCELAREHFEEAAAV